MFKRINNWIVDDIFDRLYNLSDEYKKVAATILTTLTATGSIAFGAAAVFKRLAEIGCVASISTFGLFSVGGIGILFTFVGIMFIGYMSYLGLAAIPNSIRNLKDKKRRKTTFSHKVERTKEWLKKYWSVFAIIAGVALIFFTSSYFLGYFAWLIAC